MTEQELIEALNVRQQDVETFSRSGQECEQKGMPYSAMRLYRESLLACITCLGCTHELFDKVATSEFLELATQRIDDLKRINNALRTDYDKEIKTDE